MADEARGYYGLQFHAEVTHTKQGARIYSRFVHEICGCGDAWKPDSIIDDAIARVRAQVGDGHVLLGLSGGVDPGGRRIIQKKPKGPQMTCLLVEQYLLRHTARHTATNIFPNQHFVTS